MQITVVNHLGKSMVLDNLKFPVVNVDGLTPSGATINTSSAGIADGTSFNSSFVNPRNIVLTVVPNGEPEKARLKLYEFFKPKYKVTLMFKTKYRDVEIPGYVENIEGGLYSQRQSFQISVLCPQPFFKSRTPKIVNQMKSISAFSFPFAIPVGSDGIPLSTIESNLETPIVNEGEETTGIFIVMTATGTVLEPTIYNKTTRETFTIEEEMIKGDQIEISTLRGEKRAYLIRDGVRSNILHKLTSNSKWFQLPMGENIFAFDAIFGVTNLSIEYHLYALYGGL